MILLNKPKFLTPLQTLHRFRLQNPEYKHSVLGYAGRLDPLAEGLLLILVDDENKRRKEFEKLDKEYSFKVLFGLATDSYDYMGLFTLNPKPFSKNPAEEIQKILPQFMGKQMQEYPPYSSARVNGKPLYFWARANRKDIPIPSKEIEISNISSPDVTQIKLADFAKSAVDGILKVHGEFRQKEIIVQWQRYFDVNEKFYSAKFNIRCSSGTYVRGIADRIGRLIKTGAIAYDIKRTKIGEYSSKQFF